MNRAHPQTSADAKARADAAEAVAYYTAVPALPRHGHAKYLTPLEQMYAYFD